MWISLLEIKPEWLKALIYNNGIHIKSWQFLHYTLHFDILISTKCNLAEELPNYLVYINWKCTKNGKR